MTDLAAKLKELGEKAAFETPIGEFEAHGEHMDVDAEGEIIATIAYVPNHKYCWMPASPDQLTLLTELVNNLPAIIAALEARPSPATEGEVERDKELDEAREEGFQEGYSEGQNDANHASKDTFHRVIAWLRKRDLLQDADYPEGYTAEDIADALNEHEENLVSLSKRAALSAARPSREGEMRRALEQIAAREDYSPGETEIREIARAALQPQQQKEA